MRHIKEVLRLASAGHSQRQIATSLDIARSTVGEYLRRAARADVHWPLTISDTELERALYPPTPDLPAEQRGLPDWCDVHRELKGKGMTLFLLWQEYKSTHPHGFQYSWFCEHYRAWAGKVDLVMRHNHVAG